MTETATEARPAASPERSPEREELVAILDQHRELFLITTQGLTDEQARLTPTVSALSLGGLVKHVTATVTQWLDFVEHGPAGGTGIECFAFGFVLSATTSTVTKDGQSPSRQL